MKNKSNFTTFENYYLESITPTVNSITVDIDDSADLSVEHKLQTTLNKLYKDIQAVDPRSSFASTFRTNILNDFKCKTTKFLQAFIKDINTNRYNIESNTKLSTSTRITLLKFLENNKLQDIDNKSFKNNTTANLDPFLKFNSRYVGYKRIISLLKEFRSILLEPIKDANSYGESLDKILKFLSNLNYDIVSIENASSINYNQMIDIKNIFKDHVQTSLENLCYTTNDVFVLAKETIELSKKIDDVSKSMFEYFSQENKLKTIELIQSTSNVDIVDMDKAVSIRLKKLGCLLSLYHNVLGYSFGQDALAVKYLCEVATNNKK